MTDAVTELPPPPTDAGASALRDAAALLWPAPAAVEVVRRGTPVPSGHEVVTEHLLIPDARRPRLVVPAGERRAAAVIAGGRGDYGGSRARPAAARLAVRSGLAAAAARDRIRVTVPTGVAHDDVEQVLATLLGHPVVLGLSVGAPRVNRKPILHILDRAGRTLAFVKVGHNADTRDLVRAEASTLRQLAAHKLPAIELPRVLHLTNWRDVELLVLSAVGDNRPGRVDVERPPYDAMRQLAAIDGITEAPLTASAFIAGVRQSTAGLADKDAARRFTAALDRIETVAGDTALAFGAWHGDWTPWNMTPVDRSTRVALWDWERFATDVPVGFDALHFFSQTLLQKHTATPRAEQAFLSASETTAVNGGASPGTGRLVTALYLAELAARYLTLVELPHGAPLTRRAVWIVPFLETCAASL